MSMCWSKLRQACVASDAPASLFLPARQESNVYELVKGYVIPWTCGTGMGYALLLNEDEPKEVNVMISHCFAENAEEPAMRSRCACFGLRALSIGVGSRTGKQDVSHGCLLQGTR